MKLITRSKKTLAADFPSAKAKVIFHTASYRPYILNESASAIWDFCETPRDVRSIVAFLREKYGVSATRARRDVKRFLDKTRKARIIR